MGIEESCQESVYKPRVGILHMHLQNILATADIFLFNIGKYVDTFTEINYEMLESLKDGELFSSKYDS